jgi:hypothetical protein
MIVGFVASWFNFNLISFLFHKNFFLFEVQNLKKS